jgi:hypothetical protein
MSFGEKVYAVNKSKKILYLGLATVSALAVFIVVLAVAQAHYMCNFRQGSFLKSYTR